LNKITNSERSKIQARADELYAANPGSDVSLALTREFGISEDRAAHHAARARHHYNAPRGGRPPIGDEPMVKTAFFLHREQVLYLQSFPEGASAALRRIIDQARAAEQ